MICVEARMDVLMLEWDAVPEMNVGTNVDVIDDGEANVELKDERKQAGSRGRRNNDETEMFLPF